MEPGWLIQLHEARDMQFRAEQMKTAARTKLQEAVWHAIEESGIAAAEVARTLGVSRTYLYQVLAKAKEARDQGE